MPEPASTAAIVITCILSGCAIAVGLFQMYFTHQSNDDKYNDDWWYKWQYDKKIILDDTYINKFDEFVIKYCEVKAFQYAYNNKKIPDVGFYKYYTNKKKYSILIRKIKFTVNQKEIIKYILYFKYEQDFEDFCNTFSEFVRKDNKLFAIYIDSSKDPPELKQREISCETVKNNQINVIDTSTTEWINSKNRNRKIILFGKPGVGKTYVGRLIANRLNKNYNIDTTLFESVDPSIIGFNIPERVLSLAVDTKPVIMIINEMDKIYDKVYDDKEPYDHRLQHSRNPVDFHNLLDAIGDKDNVLAIYTMESNPRDLIKKDRRYYSFMRPGRVDLFIELTDNDSTVYTHEQMFQ